MVKGVEFRFSKLDEMWEVLKFIGNSCGSYRFTVADQSLCSKGVDVTIPHEFDSAFFNEMVHQQMVPERLVIHAYPIGERFHLIDDFMTFYRSPCAMIILMYDCWYMEIYCKDYSWSKTLLCLGEKLIGAQAREIESVVDYRRDFYI